MMASIYISELEDGMNVSNKRKEKRERERQRQSGVSRVAGVCRLCTAAQRQAKEKRGR